MFWHVVYFWICKHPYLCARSRRTSGRPWRPASGRRPPLLSGAVRSSSPAPRASRLPRLPGSCTVPTKRQELTPPTDDPDPKALACYGLLVRPGPQQADQMWLRFVTGRPVSAVTIDFLAWCSAQLAAQGFTALLLIWDNASWHRSQAVRHWIRQHNQQVKRGAVGVRLVRLPLAQQKSVAQPH